MCGWSPKREASENNMSQKLPAALFLGVLMAMLPSLSAEEFKRTQVTSTERVDFAPGGVIRLNNSYGDLYVEGWDQPAVEVVVIKTMPYNYQPKHPERGAQRLERVLIRADRRSDTELAISTTRASHSGGVSVEYQIRVPRESSLVIQHGTGYVFVNNVIGDIQAAGGRGDILLMLPARAAYAIDAKSKFGTISSDFEGSAQVAPYRLGERYATGNSSAHRIHLRMGFGGITIKAQSVEGSAPKSGTDTDPQF
jgi:hypothetical protein